MFVLLCLITCMLCLVTQARTCVLVGINGQVVAALAIADPLKPEARAVVAALHAQVSSSSRRGVMLASGGMLLAAYVLHRQ